MNKIICGNYLYKLGTMAFAAILGCCLISCDKAYDNLKLDHLWRLDSIERNGVTTQMDSIYYGFATNAVEVHRIDYFYYMGKVHYIGDSLKFDFTPYLDNPEYTPAVVANRLKGYGIDSMVETFAIDQLDKQTLVLSHHNKTMYFTRW